MRNIQRVSPGRGQFTHNNRMADRWLTVELLIAAAMLAMSFGTLVTLLNWPMALSGMNYLFIIIPYLSLTCALFTAQYIRRSIQRKETP